MCAVNWLESNYQLTAGVGQFQNDKIRYSVKSVILVTVQTLVHTAQCRVLCVN